MHPILINLQFILIVPKHLLCASRARGLIGLDRSPTLPQEIKQLFVLAQRAARCRQDDVRRREQDRELVERMTQAVLVLFAGCPLEEA